MDWTGPPIPAHRKVEPVSILLSRTECVSFLAPRGSKEGEPPEELLTAVLESNNGIASGLKNTG